MITKIVTINTLGLMLFFSCAIVIMNESKGPIASIGSNNPSTYSALIPHDPIIIPDQNVLSDFPGSGTEEDPYVIEGYNITTSEQYGIYIYGETNFFVIRNCYIDALDYGIYSN